MPSSIVRRINECDIITSTAFKMNEAGLVVVNPNVDFKEWDGAMSELWKVYVGNDRFQFAVQFAVGDALNFGQQRFGDDYAQHLDGFADFHTVMNWMGIASRVPIEIRRTELQWSHHREVAFLPDTEDKANYLTIAVTRALSARDLKDLINGDMIVRLTDDLPDDERDFWRMFAEDANVRWRGTYTKKGISDWMEAGMEEAKLHLAKLVKLEFRDWYANELKRLNIEGSDVLMELAERAWMAGVQNK